MKRMIALALSLLMILAAALMIGCTTPEPEIKATDAPAGDATDAPNTQEAEAPTAQATADPAGSPEGTDAPATQQAADDGSYADSFDFYMSLLTELAETGGTYIRSHNVVIEERNPDDYYSDPDYIDIIYMPFVSLNMAMTASVNDDVDPESIEWAYEFYGYEDVKFTVNAPGSYTVTMHDEEEDGNIRYYTEYLTYANGSIRYEWQIDGVTVEFVEFVSMGDDRYALQNMTDRAVVHYTNGEIPDFCHSELRSETDWDTGKTTSWSRSYDPQRESAWGRTDLDSAWVNEKLADDGIYRMFWLANGVFAIEGWDKVGFGEDAVYEPMETITIEKNW